MAGGGPDTRTSRDLGEGCRTSARSARGWRVLRHRLADDPPPRLRVRERGAHPSHRGGAVARGAGTAPAARDASARTPVRGSVSSVRSERGFPARADDAPTPEMSAAAGVVVDQTATDLTALAQTRPGLQLALHRLRRAIDVGLRQPVDPEFRLLAMGWDSPCPARQREAHWPCGRSPDRTVVGRGAGRRHGACGAVGSRGRAGRHGPRARRVDGHAPIWRTSWGSRRRRAGSP